MRINVIAKETVKPSSPTPDHLRSYKISLLDQFASGLYVRIILFYAAASIDNGNAAEDQATIFERLRTSLSHTLVSFYPLAGRFAGKDSVDCSDGGVSYIEAQASVELSQILENPDMDVLQQFLPFDPNVVRLDNEAVITGIQVNLFNCGGVAIGLCISHRIADAATIATFLKAWSAITLDSEEMITPYLDSALHFPPGDITMEIPKGVTGQRERTSTKRFVFNAESLALLKAKASTNSIRPTTVEAVTSLIWKSAMSVTRDNMRKNSSQSQPSFLTHVVNIRRRMDPALPEESFGNLWQFAVATLVEEESNSSELHDLVVPLRKAIENVNGNYLSKLLGSSTDGFLTGRESLKRLGEMAARGEASLYRFSSWNRFPFYDVEFGFGKPVWVCTTSWLVKNLVFLMGTESGDGIEAWVTLAEKDMQKFQCEPQLLQFASVTHSSKNA